MRSAPGNTEPAASDVTESSFSCSRQFMAFKEKIRKGKKVTDEAWCAMAEKAGAFMPQLDTRVLLCTHPRVNGQGYSSIRITQLKRISESVHLSARFAEAELLRRGHTDIPIVISEHAIEGASNRYWKVWIQSRRHQQGIVTWLKETSIKAYKDGIPKEGNSLVREYQGMTFCFQANKRTLKLVTVS